MEYNGILISSLLEGIVLSFIICVLAIVPLNKSLISAERKKTKLKENRVKNKRKQQKINLNKKILITELLISCIFCIALTFNALADLIDRDYLSSKGTVTRIENNRDGLFNKKIYIDNQPYFVPRKKLSTVSLIEGNSYKIIYTKRGKLILEISKE